VYVYVESETQNAVNCVSAKTGESIANASDDCVSAFVVPPDHPTNPRTCAHRITPWLLSASIALAANSGMNSICFAKSLTAGDWL